MTHEQLTDLREQRAQLAQQLKDLDAEIKTTEAEVYKTLVLSDESAFIGLEKAYRDHGFKTNVEIAPDAQLTCTMETQGHPKLTVQYTHKRPVTTPKQCERVCGILLDYLPCIVQLLALGIPRGVYEINHTAEHGKIRGRANINGCHIRLDIDVKHSTRTGRYKQPSHMSSIKLSQELWRRADKNSLHQSLSVDDYDLSFHAFDIEERAKLYKIIELTRKIYDANSEVKTESDVSKTSLQKDLKQFAKKAKSLQKEMHLVRLW